MSDIKVLVLLGSLRAASVNRQLAELAIETAPDGRALRCSTGSGSCPSTTRTSTTRMSPSPWWPCVRRRPRRMRRWSSPPSTTAAFPVS